MTALKQIAWSMRDAKREMEIIAEEAPWLDRLDNVLVCWRAGVIGDAEAKREVMALFDAAAARIADLIREPEDAMDARNREIDRDEHEHGGIGA